MMNVVSAGSRVALLTIPVLSAISGCSKRPSVWVSRHDHYEIAVDGATELSALTHNGPIKIQ